MQSYQGPTGLARLDGSTGSMGPAGVNGPAGPTGLTKLLALLVNVDLRDAWAFWVYSTYKAGWTMVMRPAGGLANPQRYIGPNNVNMLAPTGVFRAMGPADPSVIGYSQIAVILIIPSFQVVGV